MATIAELENALRKAHAAGNVGHAKKFADAIRQMRAQPNAEWRPKRRTADDLRAAAEPVDPTEGMGFAQKTAAGFGKSFVDTGRGVGQLLGLVDESDIAQARETDAPLMATGAGMAGNILGQAAQIATPLPGGAAVGLAGKLAASGARAGAFGGAQGTVGDESRLANAGRDAAFGVAGQGVASGMGALAGRARAAMPGPVRESIELAQQAGIPLRADQVTRSVPVRAAAAVTKWFPLSGAGRQAKSQQEAFNAAVGRSFGLEDAPVLTDDVMRGARKRLSAQFEDVYNRNNIPLTPEALRQLTAVENMVAKRLTTDQAQVVRNQLDDIIKEAGDGVLTGKKYQALRTQIMKAEGPDNVGQAVKELRKTLDDIAAEAVGPEDAAKLAMARGQWANLRTTEDALKQIGGAAGNIRPAALWPLVRKGAGPGMRDLAKIGQNVLKDVVPDSGSAQRIMYQNLLTGVGGTGAAAGMGVLLPFAKVATAGATLGQLLNSRAGAAALKQGRPTSALARLLQPAPRVLPPVAGAAGLPVVGGQQGPWTAEDDAELERLRAEMEARRRASGGR